MNPFVRQALVCWQNLRGWLSAPSWSAEIIRFLVMLVIAFVVMRHQDFGYTETPYNFF